MMALITEEEVKQFKELVIWSKQQGVAVLTLGKITVSFFPEQPKLAEFNLDELKAQEKQNEENLEFYSSGR
jgi:hypothetical protein